MDLSVEATEQRDRPLLVVGFKGTPEEIERQWYEQVYRGPGGQRGATYLARGADWLMPGGRVGLCRLSGENRTTYAQCEVFAF
jgi:hypothetical protein